MLPRSRNPGEMPEPDDRPVGDREEVGEFVRLWLVILAAVAVILGWSCLVVLGCSWLMETLMPGSSAGPVRKKGSVANWGVQGQISSTSGPTNV